MSAHEPIVQVFDQLCRCFAEGDRQAFEGLCQRPSDELLDLFDRNTRKLRTKGWRLRLREVRQEGALAVLDFDVLDKGDAVVDRGEFSLGLDSEGWRVLQL